MKGSFKGRTKKTLPKLPYNDDHDDDDSDDSNNNNDDDNDDYHYQLLTLPSTFIIWKSSIDNSPSRPERPITALE